jgi:transcriptional regulator with XRE-family HTH domain
VRKSGGRARTSVQYGARFRAAREAIGWSQDKTAVKWGVRRQTVMSWEAGDTLVPVDALEWIEELAAQRRVG